MKTPFDYADKVLTTLKADTNGTFHNGMMAFDELNVIQTREKVGEMYRHLEALNRRALYKVIREAYMGALAECASAGFTVPKKSDRTPISMILTGLLRRYHPVTQYQYKREVTRKEGRTFEGVVSAQDADVIQAVLRKSAGLWFRQTAQYMDNGVDEGRLQAYRDCGVRYVRWVSQTDERVCQDCLDLNGTIFQINHLPDIPQHYNCRCYVVPVLDGARVV